MILNSESAKDFPFLISLVKNDIFYLSRVE